MSASAERLAIVVLELTGIILLAALLATPAPKHGIVNALIVASILRSICAILPPLAYEALSTQFDHISSHHRIRDFCLVVSIILRYLTVVKAAFSISFTMPMLYLAMKHIWCKDWEGCTFPGRAIIAFCIAPFLWAIPAVFIPIPTAMHHFDSLQPTFYVAVCTITDVPYHIVSLTLMVIPLVVASVASLIFVGIMWRHGYVKLPLRSQTLGVLDVTRMLRFGALLFIFVISAIVYTIVMATWVRVQVNPYKPIPMSTLFMISTFWEAITPILMFGIFGAQEEVFAVWRSWWRHFRNIFSTKWETSSESDGFDDAYTKMVPRSSHQSQLHIIPQPSYVDDSKAIHALTNSVSTQSGRGSEVTFAEPAVQERQLYNSEPDRIERLARSIPPPPKGILLKPIRRYSNQLQATSSISDATSLPPPPRSAYPSSISDDTHTLRSVQDHSTDEPASTTSSQPPLWNLPSLTAFGRNNSTESLTVLQGSPVGQKGRPDSDSDFGDELDTHGEGSGRGRPVAGEMELQRTYILRPGTGSTIGRPGTGQSSRTFGR
ncbi:hypothetical protein C8Q75DRAFT_768467 [Abortiporus biennis]|nr:hypothetical protein C8Q75DRAFT_768467 [Abortiporus biennis]